MKNCRLINFRTLCPKAREGGKELPSLTAVEPNKKFVRYEEGAKLYSMSVGSFTSLAKEAKATYKIRKMVLVNLEILDEYLEAFREE